MSYVALYRAYRPQSFTEVAGQTHVVRTLQNAIKLDKVSHAYLFSGPRGTGKTSIAKILAKTINCENGPAINPCNECDNCKSITQGSNPDVIEIDAASNNGVDEIREIRDKVKYLPSSCKRKVYIIDEVHMLSTGAFNALLKTLEEPPAHVIFILATTEPHKIPATILSRVQRFDFMAISPKNILERLNYVVSHEKINISPKALDLISTASEGGMRDALSLLDQAISYSDGDRIGASDVLAVSGNVSIKTLEDLLLCSIENKGAEAINILTNIFEDGKETTRVITDLIEFLRDILLYKNNSLIDLKEIYKEEAWIELANKINSRTIYGYLEILSETQRNVRFSNQKRSYLELAILKMSDSTRNRELDVLDRLTKLENSVARNSNMVSAGVKECEVRVNSKPRPVYEEPEVFNDEPEVLNHEPEAPIMARPTKNIVPKDLPEENKENKEDKRPKANPNVPKAATSNSYVTINMIESVLLNGDKNLKLDLAKTIKSVIEKNPNDLLFNILGKGTVVAANKDKFIIALPELSKCNRLMQDKSFKKVINRLVKEGINIPDMIAIPANNWNDIQADFVSQYKATKDMSLIKLKEQRILVRQHVEIEEEEDKGIKLANELFDKDQIKII